MKDLCGGVILFYFIFFIFTMEMVVIIGSLCQIYCSLFYPFGVCMDNENVLRNFSLSASCNQGLFFRCMLYGPF